MRFSFLFFFPYLQTPAERVKAKMKLQLSQTGMPGVGSLGNYTSHDSDNRFCISFYYSFLRHLNYIQGITEELRYLFGWLCDIFASQSLRMLAKV